MPSLPVLPAQRLDRITGALLGVACGDALGLPYEGLSPARARKLFGDGPLRHRLVAGRGMVSDDTDHSCLVGQALLSSGGEPSAFARDLARELRWWLLALPPGVGFATLRGLLRSALGVPPGRSGVHSAGNGPAMRAPLLGAAYPHDLDHLRALVDASTRITHTDPRALEGARAVAATAAAAARAASPTAPGLRAALLEAAARELEHPDWAPWVQALEESLQRGWSPRTWADNRGQVQGVTGFVVHTVPAALFCVLRAPGDPRQVIEEAVGLGGDADTVAAIAGGLAGAASGAGALPREWLEGLAEWPRNEAWMRHLCGALAARLEDPDLRRPGAPLPCPWWPSPLRNLAQLGVVVGHVARRLLP